MPRKDLLVYCNDLEIILTHNDSSDLNALELVATGEKDFSELKIIKHYLRTSYSQNRLNGLAMLASH
nr:unnamed protein product [Callosobruchus analis]